MIKNILFDLDGTLIDSSEGVTKAVKYALEKKGYKIDNLNDLKVFIGPPLCDMFIKYMGLSSEKEGREMVSIYREYYTDTGVYENTLYDGIKETLYKLKEMGYNLYVATSKPTVFSKEIMKQHNLTDAFICISGCELDGTRDSKQEVIQYLLDNYNLNPDETLMVGDRIFDVEGAGALGIKTLGVLFGFGNEEEFKDAIAVAKTASEIPDIVKKL